MNNRFYGHATQPQTWRDMLKELKAAKEELRRNAGIMTPYERQTIAESIQARANEVAGRLQGGAIAEWNAAKGIYQDKAAAVEKARVAEINRWDNARLGAEIGAVKALVDLAYSSVNNNPLGGIKAAAPRLERIYNEAMASGDMHKQRAAAEVFRSLAGDNLKGDIESRAAVSGLAHKAEKDLPALRMTDEITKAIQARDDAAQAVYNLKPELNDVSEVMGYGDASGPWATGAVATAFKGVKFNADHTLTLYADDSPEVMGFDWKNLKGHDPDGPIVIGGEVENE